MRTAFAWVFTLIAGVSACLTSARSDPLTVMFGISRPPYVMEDTHGGISIALAREAFGRLNVEFHIVHGSNRRMEQALRNGTVDAAIEVQHGIEGVYYSDRFIAYRNYVVTRKADNITFRTWPDLAGQRVCAWQNANENLGAAFRDNITRFRDYAEFAEQLKQVRQWLIGRCDAIVIDDTLLKWWALKLEPSLRLAEKYVEGAWALDPLPDRHTLWWYAAFQDETVRDRFTRTLAAMREDGTYDRIREAYSSPVAPR